MNSHQRRVRRRAQTRRLTAVLEWGRRVYAADIARMFEPTWLERMVTRDGPVEWSVPYANVTVREVCHE